MTDHKDVTLRLEVLGPLRARLGEEEVDLGPVQQRVVLGVLAMSTGQPIGREQMIEAVWGPRPPVYAVNLVQKHVSGLRRRLDPARPSRSRSPLLTWSAAGYRLNLADEHLDLRQFDLRLARARAARAAGDRAAAGAALHGALRLWRGPFLDGLSSPLIDAERDRLAERRVAALEERIEIDLALGTDDDLVTELRRLVTEHPLRERLRGLLMQALHRSGRRAEALAVFRDTHRFLREELGVQPTAELEAVHQRLLRDDAPPAGAAGAPAAAPPWSAPPAEPPWSAPPPSPLWPADPADPGDPAGRVEPADPAGRAEPAAPARAARRVTAPAQLPHGMADFTGRHAQLRRLDELLLAPAATATAIATVTGTAGVGKTSLAVHWAHRASQRFPDGQLYVNLRGFDQHSSPVEPGEALRGFLHAYGVPAEQIPTGLDEQAGLYRSVLAGRRVLVVLDNARDAEQIRPLLPGGAGCAVVVTSRRRLADLVTAGAVAVTVDLFDADEAREFLSRRVGAARVTATPEAVEAIVAACARLPLALAIVSARAAVYPEHGLDAVAEELRQADGRLDAFVGDSVATDARAVLSWSYQRLSPEAARLFRMLGLHAGPDATLAAAASLAGLPEGTARRLLSELSGAHLIEEQLPGRFCTHDLLRAYANELALALDSDADRDAAKRRLLDHYLHTAARANRTLYPYRRPIALDATAPAAVLGEFHEPAEALIWLMAEYPALLNAVVQAQSLGFSQHASRLAWTITAFLNYQGKWFEWKAALGVALTACRELSDTAGEALTHRLLSLAELQHGRLAEAETHTKHALELFEQLGDVAAQARLYLEYSRVLERQEQYEAALARAELSLRLFETAQDRHGEADALNRVGWCHSRLGLHERALHYSYRSLDLHRELGDSPSRADSWDALGYAHHRLGEHDKAMACYEQALAIWRGLGDQYEVATTLLRLGDIQAALDDPRAARALWRQARDVLQHIGHPLAEQMRDRLDGPQPSSGTEGEP
ncbi:BTAD domain-containing putative transcriptional regulator [Plantactinospora sp. KBS50]|uniref:AfsR/SARP family transcriptional regulator n=1 Tax=Plantactinospora sp. KBS50 TaxID=2024580 RepID=UPI0018DFBCD7|nr:BTAD domain-containing putative transcriptional regulator [Plantactinospora sp. KBS50]